MVNIEKTFELIGKLQKIQQSNTIPDIMFTVQDVESEVPQLQAMAGWLWAGITRRCNTSLV